MAKAAQRQPKLTFNGGKKKSVLAGRSADDMQLEEEGPTSSVKSMFFELKHSLASIDAKFDHLTEQMGHLKEWVDGHDTCFEQLESPTLDLEDNRCGDGEQLLCMERMLGVIWNKNEDLEARSHCNNICILGLPESTAMGRMEKYVEIMLSELFPGELSLVLVVERAHRSLGPLTGAVC
ncbi:hypothetical protein NDU88_006182 [Pleurodeles waltl]|uniref:Uncharacterized protein n=1 Tax=Pleurodeles waltl TaxID=8319 RepID=A0AAV7VQC0_PLEWA|nr:hypothetical protein NDU88_006182 [Pleurodeles waltl]